MSLALDEQTLEDVARNGEMDYDKWPSMLEPLLQRLNEIVYSEFPMPKPYPPTFRQPHDLSISQPQSQQQANPSTPVRNLPPVPPFPSSSAAAPTPASRVPDSQPPASQDASPELPAPLLQLLNSITSTLRTSFPLKPPHTIQRLSELILYPTKTYRTLPAWLRALDRVISVSSGADIFPLSDSPTAANGINGDGGGILWTNSSSGSGYDRDSLGSDESLGGALLTPIPWLRNGAHAEDTQDGMDGSTQSSGSDGVDPLSTTNGSSDPLVPVREDGAVTQGELMRLEQEAGVVPVHQSVTLTRGMAGLDDNTFEEDDEDDEDVPHARGPDVVGALDIGKVDGRDVEIRIGSPMQEAGVGMAATAGGDQSAPSSTAGTEDFEIISKEGDGEGDVMQVDGDENPRKKDDGDDDDDDDDDDEDNNNDADDDIVLVDADDKIEDNDSKPAADVAAKSSPDAKERSTDA